MLVTGGEFNAISNFSNNNIKIDILQFVHAVNWHLYMYKYLCVCKCIFMYSVWLYECTTISHSLLATSFTRLSIMQAIHAHTLNTQRKIFTFRLLRCHRIKGGQLYQHRYVKKITRKTKI